MALGEVGMVVGPQGSLVLAVAADHFLHLAVGVEQALLTGPSLGPTAPEGSKEPMASLTQVGREEGVQFLPVEEGRSMRLCGWWLASSAKFSGSGKLMGAGGLDAGCQGILLLLSQRET